MSTKYIDSSARPQTASFFQKRRLRGTWEESDVWEIREGSGRSLGGVWDVSMRDLGCLWEVPWRSGRSLGGALEASEKHLGGIWEAPWEAAWRHLGPEGDMGGQSEVWKRKSIKTIH